MLWSIWAGCCASLGDPIVDRCGSAELHQHLCHGRSNLLSQSSPPAPNSVLGNSQQRLECSEGLGSFGQKLELLLLNPSGLCFKNTNQITPKTEKLPPTLGPEQSLGAVGVPILRGHHHFCAPTAAEQLCCRVAPL